jgi:hypothetical protein
MYNYYSQNQYRPSQQQTQSFTLKGRPVASLEEARAAAIDFDGSIFLFPDVANKRIYTKQINMDGTLTLNMYELKEIPNPIEESNLFVTREEFERAINELKGLAVPAQEIVEPAPAQARPDFEIKF